MVAEVSSVWLPQFARMARSVLVADFPALASVLLFPPHQIARLDTLLSSSPKHSQAPPHHHHRRYTTPNNPTACPEPETLFSRCVRMRPRQQAIVRHHLFASYGLAARRQPPTTS